MIAKIIVTIIYVAIVGYLGYLGYRNTKNAQDYLIGGRKIHPAIMALSYGAAFISTLALCTLAGCTSGFGRLGQYQLRGAGLHHLPQVPG